jgi:replication factor A1
MDTDKIRRQIAKQSPSGPTSTQIRDLRHGMKKINLRAEVVETQKPKQVHTQFGNAVMMTNATIGDESGKIKLLLWDQQVNAVATGDIIEIKNASVSTFKGEKQLRLGKTGTLCVIQGETSLQKIPAEPDPKKVICA